MTQTSVVPPTAARVRMGLLVGCGGACFTIAVLWLAQLLASGLTHSRLMERPSSGMLMVGLAWFVLGGLIWLVLALCQIRLVRFSLLLGIWLAAYLLLWALGVMLGGISLLIYLVAWLLAGLLGAQFAAELQLPPAPPPRRAPVARAVVETSEFGRVPRTTVVLLERCIHQARTNVLRGLPPAAPEELRDWTLRAVLDCMLRDWWEHGNTEPLSYQHLEDLRSFVLLALVVSRQAGPDEPLRAPLRQAVYRATLRALLDDWLHNWNTDGDNGPPQRYSDG